MQLGPAGKTLNLPSNILYPCDHATEVFCHTKLKNYIHKSMASMALSKDGIVNKKYIIQHQISHGCNLGVARIGFTLAFCIQLHGNSTGTTYGEAEPVDVAGGD